MIAGAHRVFRSWPADIQLTLAAILCEIEVVEYRYRNDGGGINQSVLKLLSCYAAGQYGSGARVLQAPLRAHFPTGPGAQTW